MTTPILEITELANGQINQFATANDAFRALEAALQAVLPVDLSSGSHALQDEDFLRNLIFVATGNTTSRTISIPQKARVFLVRNSGSASLDVVRGSTTIAIASGKSRVLYTDGTANGLVALDLS